MDSRNRHGVDTACEPRLAGQESRRRRHRSRRVLHQIMIWICRMSNKRRFDLDSSGCDKGTSAALMMANLQAVAHGRLLLFDNANLRPAPDAFVAGLNRDISGRFGDNRYATLFYGDFDSRTGTALRERRAYT